MHIYPTSQLQKQVQRMDSQTIEGFLPNIDQFIWAHSYPSSAFVTPFLDVTVCSCALGGSCNLLLPHAPQV